MLENVIIFVFLDAFNIVAVGSTCLGGATQCPYFGTVPLADNAKSQVLQELPKIILLPCFRYRVVPVDGSPVLCF